LQEPVMSEGEGASITNPVARRVRPYLIPIPARAFLPPLPGLVFPRLWIPHGLPPSTSSGQVFGAAVMIDGESKSQPRHLGDAGRDASTAWDCPSDNPTSLSMTGGAGVQFLQKLVKTLSMSFFA